MAIAVTIGGFIGVRLLIDGFLRQHYLAAVTAYYKPASAYSPPGSAWVISHGAVSKYGQVFAGGSGPQVNGVPVERSPSLLPQPRVQRPGFADQGAPAPGDVLPAGGPGTGALPRISPPSRYWPFQGIETGIYLALAAALLAVTFVVMRRRDA